MSAKRTRFDGAEVLTPERVMQIAWSKGEFRVSWRYRDETLARICAKLCKLGWLKKVRTAPGEHLFMPKVYPISEPKEPTP